MCVRVCLLGRFSHFQLCVTPWTATARLLCPWDSPGKNTGVGCRALLLGIFLTQESNLHLLGLPVLAGRFFTTSTTWETHIYIYGGVKKNIFIYIRRGWRGETGKRKEAKNGHVIKSGLCENQSLWASLGISKELTSGLSPLWGRDLGYPPPFPPPAPLPG